ncbi:MAG: molybdate ABC transporter substrate-binding protein [Oscillibacter sp.]|nr:molybdate ABC transporter substrate-binding protein [Oscillibacter sp.]
MKKLLLLLCILLFLSACSGPEPYGNGAETFRELRNIELSVLADSSLSDVLPDIMERYRESNPGVRLRVQFAPSGALAAQIREGAPCDLFLSASPEAMSGLDDSGYLLQDSRVDLLENRLVLAVPEGNPRGIRNFTHMAALIRQNGALFAAANAGDTLGAYTQTLFESCSLNKAELSQSVTYAPDAKETVTRVRSLMADGGIVYRTDADMLSVVDTADEKALYSVAVLSGSQRPLAAAGLAEYLSGAEAEELFTRAGFDPVSEPQEAAPAVPYWEAMTPEEGFTEDPAAVDGY